MKKILFLGIILTLALTACNFPGYQQPGEQGVPTVDLVNTAAALTVEALQTEMASENGQVDQPTLAPTWTLEATQTPTESVPTQTPQPTNTPYPTATNTPQLPCNVMSLVRDYTIPDETTIHPGVKYTKVWQVKNVGRCTWDTGYSIIFSEGNSMEGPASQGLSEAVAPGETTLLVLELRAPSAEDEYRGTWRLRSTSGEEFGKFWSEIDVDVNSGAYIFSDYLCAAEWRNDVGILPCPGDKDSKNGYAYINTDPRFETGYKDDEDAIIMSPRKVDDGKLYGNFFKFKLPDNPHFRTIVGCTYDKPNCEVKVTIKYRIEGEETDQVLTEFYEETDDAVTNVDIDLGALGLSSKVVAFKFTVSAHGSSNDDEIFMLVPQVYSATP